VVTTDGTALGVPGTEVLPQALSSTSASTPATPRHHRESTTGPT
jgi:hypothetical protein